jgi:sugar lactone lactonase YvrE
MSTSSHSDDATMHSNAAAGVRRIADGFSLAEAPVVDTDGHLLVADVLVGGVRRFDVDGHELESLLAKRRGIGGMGVRADGTVIVSGRDLSLVDAGGALSTLVPLPDGGTGFNDLMIAPDGTVIAGVLTCHPLGGGDLTPGLLAVITPDGDARFTPLDFCWPNGIGLSPDEGTLYVSDFHTGIVHSGRWNGPSLAPTLEPWVQSPTGDADGLTITPDGSVWVAGGAGGCLIGYDPSGELVDRIDLPGEFVSSSCRWPKTESIAITTAAGVWLHPDPSLSGDASGQ